MSLKRMSWAKYEAIITQVATELIAKKLTFDMAIGIARAGLPVLTSLASLTSIRNVGVILMQRTISDEPFSAFFPEALLLGYAFPSELDNQRVLLVDNVVHSGKTIVKAAELLRRKGAGSVVCAALARHEDQYPIPVIAPIKLAVDDWIIWPWEQRSAFVICDEEI